MYKIYYILGVVLFLSSCLIIKRKYRIEYRSDAEVVEYVKKGNYQFDIITRCKENRTLTRIPAYGITGMQFVNLYDPKGKLIKNESGGDCEIKIMSFIKDSLQNIRDEEVQCDSCDYSVIEELTRPVYSKEGLNYHGRYRIVIGWSIFMNGFSALRARTRIVTNMVAELKQKHSDAIVIGLNFDFSPELRK